MALEGYSGTPLKKKLGIKDDFVIMLIHCSGNYMQLIGQLDEKVVISNDTSVKKDFIHFFCQELKLFEEQLLILKEQLKPAGMLWISWPKKTSKIKTDVSEDAIRNFALKNGLVDIKVCAVDEVWSGLKLVIPLKLRIEKSLE